MFLLYTRTYTSTNSVFCWMQASMHSARHLTMLLQSLSHWKRSILMPFKKPYPELFLLKFWYVTRELLTSRLLVHKLQTSISHRACNSLQRWVSGQKTSPCTRTRWLCIQTTFFMFFKLTFICWYVLPLIGGFGVAWLRSWMQLLVTF